MLSNNRFIEQTTLALLIGTNRSTIRLDEGVITLHLGAALLKCRRNAVKSQNVGVTTTYVPEGKYLAIRKKHLI